MESPPQPALRATTAEWLPPRAFLPPDTAPAAARVWTAWDPTQGTTPRPRNLGRVGAGHEAWDAQTALNDLTAAVAADRVYESVGALAADLRAQLAALEASPEFRPWQRLHPDFKPRLSGLLATMQGPPRRVTVLLDTGATHCFICARLAAALDLPPSGQPGPVSVLTAAPGGGQALAAPVLVHLCWATRFARSCRSHRWIWTLAMTLSWAGTGSQATTCAIFTLPATSSSSRAPHGCSWISFRLRPARRHARCRC